MYIKSVENNKYINSNISFTHALITGKLPKYLYNSQKPFAKDTVYRLSYLRYYLNGITKKQGHFKINLHLIKDTNNCAIHITHAQNREFSLIEQFYIYSSKQIKTACENLKNRMVSYRMGRGAKFDTLPNDIITIGRRKSDDVKNERYLLRFILNSPTFITSKFAEERRKILNGWIEK